MSSGNEVDGASDVSGASGTAVSVGTAEGSTGRSGTSGTCGISGADSPGSGAAGTSGRSGTSGTSGTWATTGTSGSGTDVEKVTEATARVRERAPDLLVEGPIQYDAAIDAAVARTKLPDSAVAGRATVFVFPDLNTGNNTYKAVQRSAGALAVGPVLQGLRKPVNDLSRGALVRDIVNTVAITAIQAQERS